MQTALPQGGTNFSLSDAIDIGNQGIQLFNKGNYPQAKALLIQACDLMMKILPTMQTDKQNAVKQGIGKLLTYAEQAKMKLKALEDPKDEYIKIIKETIIDQKPDISFAQIGKMNKDFKQSLNPTYIAGLNDVKEQLYECLIMPNLRPDLFQGIRSPPKGILFYGPPGNGKTMLAKGVATECKATFFNISASSLVTKYVGDSEKLLKSLFKLAYINQPTIIYIDEIDSLLTQRNQNEHEASRRLKTEFLVQMDGVASTDQDRVVVIGTTNLPQDLDGAVLRRFSKRILIDMPDLQTKVALLKNILKEVPHNISEKEFQTIAKSLQGYSCSDIKALVKEACMEPLRNVSRVLLMSIRPDEIRKISKKDIDQAKLRVLPSVNAKNLEKFYEFQKQQASVL